MGDFFKKMWRTIISSLASEIHLSNYYSEAYDVILETKVLIVFFRKYRQIFGM